MRGCVLGIDSLHRVLEGVVAAGVEKLRSRLDRLERGIQELRKA